MNKQHIAEIIAAGKGVIGIELGSTRIKAVLIDENHDPIASGSHEWENQLVNGVWTYSIDAVWNGLQDAFRALKQDVEAQYGVKLQTAAAMGFSAMMHGYLPFDKNGVQLAEFRTWRNTMTEEAAAKLTELFQFNIPQRWSIAHLYQAMLNGESHVGDIDFLTTLAGYVHWKLTGKRVMGVGECSGMFPIDSVNMCYDKSMMEKFDLLAKDMGYSWTLEAILPEVLNAGDAAGCLTPEGALLLDPSGELKAGIPFCAPEGDAGTGMAATNSVAPRTGNVSAGTSVFAMIVLEKALSKVYPEIDMVTTPTGKPVAMVHCNNCTSDLNDWANVLKGFTKAVGSELSSGEIFPALFNAAMAADKDCGGVVNVNYLSGEPVTGLEEGRPMIARLPGVSFTFGNFARALVYGAIVTLKLGMDILSGESVEIDSLLGHGGFFKTPKVGQSLLAAALNTPVSVMETAGEGGPWGMALLAAYSINKKDGQTLENYLSQSVFSHAKSETISPDPADVEGFNQYAKRFTGLLSAERAAVKDFR